MTDCDVLVVGGGPAGCATAIKAARGGLSTVLLDRAPPARSWAGESLPPGTGTLARSVFGDAILSERHHRPAYGTRSVWGSDDLVETDFLTNPLGNAWLLDRARFDADARAATVAAGVRIAEVRHLATVSGGGSGWQLETGEGERLSTAFLVDATGRSGAVLRKFRIGRTDADRQIAILATFRDDGDAYRGTTVEAVANGWWYTTPLPAGRRVLAYMTDEDLWRRGELDWHALLAQTHHIRTCAGANATTATPGAYPAATSQATELAGENWLAVGDAAASFDPLSSQGLGSAILMGARAGEALAHPGRAEAIAAWGEAYAMLVAEHADLRIHYARLERRWPNAVFWRRRQETADARRRPGWVRGIR